MKGIGIWKEHLKTLGSVCDERSLRKITAEPRETEGTIIWDKISNFLVRTQNGLRLHFWCIWLPRLFQCGS